MAYGCRSRVRVSIVQVQVVLSLLKEVKSLFTFIDHPFSMSNAETRFLQATLDQRRRIFEDKQNQIALLEQIIQRHQNEVHLRLFPPVRPDRDAAYISSLIEEKCAELTQLQNAITAQETKSDARESSDSGLSQSSDILTQLKRQWATTHAHSEHLRSLLCPIRLLPVELLTEIFILSCDPMGSASLSNAILAVTHVCSSWRNIAIHNPELWSSLKLDPVHFATRPHGVISLAGLWLKRSGDHPLRLRADLRVTILPQPTITDLFLQLVRLYTPHFARWKDVSFDHRTFAGNHELFSDIPHNASLPHLEGFEIMANNIAFADRSKISQLLTQAPKLTRLIWMTKSHDQDPSFMYNQLMQLEVRGEYPLAKALTILSHTRLLRILDISVLVLLNTDVVQAVNKSLQEFTLVYAGDASVLFDTLTLPAIQHLHITRTHGREVTGPSTWSQGSFIQFLCRSKCNLTSLGIVSCNISPDEVLGLLRHLSPSLVKFNIEGFQHRSITDEILIALTYPAEDPLADTDDSPTILCPLLRYLRMVGCLSTTDGVLARMVESRCYSPPGLASLEKGEFSLDSAKSPQDKATISALNEIQTSYSILDENGLA